METINRDDAWTILTEYNTESFHLKHAQIMEKTMFYFANELGYAEEADYWAMVGLMHDLDFERYPDEHCVRSQEIMRERGFSEDFIRSTASHGYGMTDADIEPTHEMEKLLFATDELTGLIGATALMRPSKSVMDLETKSVKKKFKTASFAAGCSREVISRGAELLGWQLEDLIGKTILAMRFAEEQGIRVYDEPKV